MVVRLYSGPDRHHQRKQAQLVRSLETAHTRVDKKVEAVTQEQAKVAQSEAQGHGKRLKQRQCTLGDLGTRVQRGPRETQQNSLRKPPPWAQPDSGQIATSASRRS